MKSLNTVLLALLAITIFISCRKEYSFEGGKKLSDGTWQFQNKSVQYTGNIDSAFIENVSGTKVLILAGTSLNGEENFRITLYTTDSFTVRSYVTTSSESNFDYSIPAKTIFKGDFLGGSFIVNITSLSDNTITGTFSGQVEDSTGAQTQITLGSFTSSIDLSKNTSTQQPVSTGTLGVTADTCTPATLAGTFKKGRELSSSNTVQIKVNVTSPGTFVIATNSVNGVNFLKAGTFTTTGVQDVILEGDGTPQNEGEETFTITYGNSNCVFSINFEAPDPPATGTLGGSPGNCTSITPEGSYTKGVQLDESNTISVEVNVATAGSYEISTNTVNGVVFSASGSFLTTGLQTVLLAGSGTPTNSGSHNFTVTFGSNTCNFSLTFDAPPSPATGSLGGDGGECTPVTPAGTYTQGVALGASNTITIQANVTSTGPYSIATNTVNGVTFTSSGTFTTTGIQSIVLNGSGLPTNSGVQNFSVSFGTSTCDFPVTFLAGVPAVYSCKIDGVLTNFTDQAEAEVIDDFTGDPYLYLNGYMPGSTNTVAIPQFQIFITKNDASAVTAGTYDEKHLAVFPGGYRIEIDYKLENPDQSVTIWNTSSNLLPPPNPPFTIIVTSISATRVKGTFSGTLTNTLQGSTAFKVITEGVFDLPIVN